MVTRDQINAIAEDPQTLRDAALRAVEFSYRIIAERDAAIGREASAISERDAAVGREASAISARDAAIDRAVKAEQELALTLHRLRVQLAARFGKRIEKLDQTQLSLFAQEVGKSEEEAKQETVLVPAHHRVKRGRQPIPEHLPREEVRHEPAAEDRACPCCKEPRVEISASVREVIEIVPAQVKVIRHVRPVYACPACRNQIVRAPGPSLPLGKSYAGASLLAMVAVSKFCDHAPLYRQESILTRSGIDLSRSTLCTWLGEGAELIAPLVDLMQAEMLLSSVIQTDDTPLPTLGVVPGRAKEGRLWVYLGDKTHRHVIFEFTTSREGKWPQRRLEKFQGFLQSDAYAGYAPLHESGRVTEVACWAHARRKFHESRDLAPGFCLEVMQRIGSLYAIEGDARKQDLNASQRAALRAEKSRAILEDLLKFLEIKRTDHLPKSPVRAAIEYVLSRTRAFTRYLDHGELEIDNNACERALRCVAIGRKNWLFAGSAFGGERAAAWFTLIASARLAEVEPWHWLTDTLTRLAKLRDHAESPDERDRELRALLPATWLESHPEARLPISR